jgi:hypothetical protein
MSKSKMDGDNSCMRKGVLRRLNDKTQRVEVGRNLRETAGAIILKGTQKAEFPIEIIFSLATWKCDV